MSQQTYSEKEIAEIIRLASEMEPGRTGSDPAPGELPGLSLEELTEAAAEAGIDPENIRRAAEQVRSPSGRVASGSNQNEVFAERWVRGEFTGDLADLVISELNNRFNTTHQKESLRDNILGDGHRNKDGRSSVRRTGKNLEWTYPDDRPTADVRVLVQPLKDKIKIRVTKKRSGDVGAGITKSPRTAFRPLISYLGAIAILLLLPFSWVINLVAAFAAFAGLATVFGTGIRPIDQRLTGGTAQDKKELSMPNSREVEEITAELAGLIGKTAPEANASGRIDLPESPDADENTGNRSAGDKTRSGPS